MALLEYWFGALVISFTFFLLMQWVKKRVNRLSLKSHNQPFLSLVMVTSNDEKIVEGVIRRLAKLNYFQKDGSLNYELIGIDDGSKDQTFDILERLSRIYPLLKVDRRRPGESSIERGLAIARGEKVCLLDKYSFLETNLLGSISARITEERIIDLRKNRKRRIVSKYGVQY